jgi:hypothetical protein
MKSNLTQQRFKAPKKSACGLCKPHKRGWAGKRKAADIRLSIGHEQQLREAENL